jgi:hypothetical protein
MMCNAASSKPLLLGAPGIMASRIFWCVHLPAKARYSGNVSVVKRRENYGFINTALSWC